MNLNSHSDLLFEQVYQDDYCQVSISINRFCICQCYFQLPLSIEFLKPSMELVLSLAREWSASGNSAFYLVEVMEGQLLPSEDITWVRKDVIPQMADAGIGYIAYVSENNLFRQFSQGNIMESGSVKSLNMRIFQDKQDALSWLGQIHKVR